MIGIWRINRGIVVMSPVLRFFHGYVPDAGAKLIPQPITGMSGRSDPARMSRVIRDYGL